MAASARTLPTCLAAWLELLEQRHAQTIQLGLERVASVQARLAAESDAVLITVAGTNGKGSCCAMLEAILLAEGYRVGCYTSPHLLRYNERVRVLGIEAGDEELAQAFAAVEAARGETALTYFEHGTLAAWWLFSKKELDVIILEVGLGGRLDAVNVFDPDCALISSIAVDHVAYLGSDRETIGLEKAGILRPGRPAVCGDPQPPQSLLARAQELEVPLWVSGRDFGFGGDRQQWGYWRYQSPSAQGALKRRGGLAYPGLRGANQLLNAAAVMTVLEVLRDRIPVSMQAIREGLLLVEVAGRFQVLPGRPSVVLDVAHNPQAVGVLAENLGSMGFFPETWAVFGMLDDKDVEAVADLIKGRIDHWLLVDLPDPRGLKATALKTRLEAAGVSAEMRCMESPREAFAAAQREAGEGDRIVVFGSFLTVAEVLAEQKSGRS